MQCSLSFAGAGRVAGALCREFFAAGFKIGLVVSERDIYGRSLADECNASWSSSLCFPESTGVIIVAVSDHNLRNVLAGIKCSRETVVAHTAGSLGLDIFPEVIRHRGVFYPLQTFSHGRKIEFKDLPFFIEGSDDESSGILKNLAERIGVKAYYSDAYRRRKLHLAAVFACNFTNHMLAISREIAFKEGFSFDVLKPLVAETFLKAIDNGPENSQTGPAVRDDQNIIDSHMELLSFSPRLMSIYREISKSITEYYKKLD
jgi:predicted short-subunit dehydrogenase-like oxidoreductase (DUF2520 family)